MIRIVRLVALKFDAAMVCVLYGSKGWVVIGLIRVLRCNFSFPVRSQFGTEFIGLQTNGGSQTQKQFGHDIDGKIPQFYFIAEAFHLLLITGMVIHS